MPNDTAFARHWMRPATALACGVLAMAISACSMVRIGYEAAPWYVAWQLDRYWALDSAQADYGRERADDLQRWHRRSELPEYSRWLRRLNERIQAPVDLAEVVSWRREIAGFWERAARRVAPELAGIIVTLRAEQIETMRRRIASENDDYSKEYLAGDPVQRQARRVKRVEQRIEYYLGEVTAEQRDIVRQKARAMEQSEQVWFKERLARQDDFSRLIAGLGRAGQPQSEAQREEVRRLVTDYLVSWWEPRDPARREALERVMIASDEVTVAVLGIATPRQRERLSRRLLGWAADADALAVQVANQRPSTGSR